MKFACRITKARIQKRTHKVEYSLLFKCNNGYKKAPQYYFTRTLPVFLYTAD
jgi:hypothetical protein